MSQIKQIKKIKLDNTIYDLHDANAVHSVNGQSPDASGNVSVTAVIEQNQNLQQKFWRGTQAEYDALTTKDEDTMYIVTDASGVSSGDMLKEVYDTENKSTDIFKYVDTSVSNKMENELGQVPNANLLEWANIQTLGGSFLVNPTITTEGVPEIAWYAGFFEINGSGRRLTISTGGGGLPITYINVAAAGEWQGWRRLASKDEVEDLLFNKMSWSRNKISGSLLEWVAAQQTPNTGYIEPDATDVPESGYYIVEVNCSHSGSNWKSVQISRITDGKIFYNEYNYGAWVGWREIITSASIGSQSVNYANSAGNANTVDGWHMNLDPHGWGIKPHCAGTGGMASGSTGLSNGHIYMQYE